MKKHKVTGEDIVKLESALNLKVLSGFEENFLNNLTIRFREYGFSMVITTKQRRILEELYVRYQIVYLDHK